MTKNIEVEVRGLLNEGKYNFLIDYLDKNGTDKEIDDRKTTFFIMSEKTLKISEKKSKGIAKISLKVGDIVKDLSQKEFEITIEPKDFDIAEKIFYNLGFTQIQHTEQKRINYNYKNCEFAVKWSVDWGYHFEIEQMVELESEVEQSNQKLLSLAKELDLTLMSEAEFGKRCAEIDEKYNPSK